MTKLTVIDSIMGSGKTTFIINRMNALGHPMMQSDEAPAPTKFIYVTPLLTEVDRVQQACPLLHFKDPQPVHGKKLWHLQTLIEERENIATTHELFKLLNQSVYHALREALRDAVRDGTGGYTLVIDEVLTTCDHFTDLSKDDQAILFDGGYVFVEGKNRRLRWDHNKFPRYSGKFSQIRDLCDNGNLVVFGEDSKNRQVILWQFPSEFLSCFNEVYILTYMFAGSPMKPYLEAEGMAFDMKGISSSSATTASTASLVDWTLIDESQTKKNIRELVSIYEGKMNNIGLKVGKVNPLSSTWMDRITEENASLLRSSLQNFFKKIAKTPAEQNAWTTFKKAKGKLAGKGYYKDSNWIPQNAKASNQWIEKRSLAFIANKFNLPIIKQYFQMQGIEVSDDAYALSEMIQWIWRSGIRRGDPITVYIPSDRMRMLFKKWLKADNPQQFLEQCEQ